MTWREDRLLRWLGERARPARLAGSHGHDAAVLRRPRGRAVVCVDQAVEGVHAEPGTAASRLGRKAVARAVSDLAATAARPVAVVLALRAPAEKPERWLRAAIEGAAERAVELGAELVGGDLACAPGPAALAATALGELGGRRRPPGRDRAGAGQVLLLTGPVGGSRLGRHLEIEPRLAEGRWLWERGATALMDVSDGLALDASRLARASGVGLELREVPLHDDARRAARASGRSPLEHALSDGEDHELLATLDAALWRRVRGAAARRFPRLREVGVVTAGAGVRLRGEDGRLRRLAPAGWVHRG